MRWRRTLLVVALVVSVAPILTTATAAVAAPASCAPTGVTLRAAPSESSYGPGAVVHVTVSLHNHSASACSFVTGPFSPNFNLTNSAGVTVWASCWYNGGPAPCPYYLLHRTLAPGATYRDRLTWDQRTGHPDVAVPAGRYTFTVRITGLALHATAHVVLTRPSVAG